jgi:zinc protease
VDKLVAGALAEIEVLKTKGPSAENVDKVMTSQRREREVQLKDNGFWTYALSNHWWYGTDAKLILDFDKLVARLSPAVLQGAAKRYFGKDSVLGVLKPEK